jgi:hypothetical protein
MPHYTQHIAGEFDKETRLQACTMCGLLLLDNSNHPDESAKGFAPGPLYQKEEQFVFGHGPVTTKYIYDTDTFEPCV